MTLRAALYCRVSTEEQAMEGYSIDAQKEKLEAFCSFSVNDQGEDAYTVVKTYVDEGYSGKKDRNRPGYCKMLEEISEWDAIIVLKMDRIHRNTRNFMNMMDLLNRRGKQFVSATEDLDTSNATGRFVMSMIQSIAQLESEQIGERTYVGMRQKAETIENTEDSSRTMGFTAPFGYRLEEGELTEEPDELNQVAWMFDACIRGESMSSIADSLNHSNVRTRRGNRWTNISVAAVLHNPIYAGFVRWQELRYRHYAAVAVDVKTFNKVQMITASRVKDPSKRNPMLLNEEGVPDMGSA